MPYVGSDFDPMDTGETKDLSFDFRPHLACGDSVLTVAWSIALIDGIDATPTDRLSGDPKVDCGVATQRHTTLQGGAKYRTKCTATTRNGEILILYSHVRGIADDDDG
jgi:hypothetical protein